MKEKELNRKEKFYSESVSYTHLWKQLRERWKKITNFQSFKIKKHENDEVK